VAALLNITPDHLDRYRDLEDYALAKARLFMNQEAADFAIANARDARTVALAGASRAELLTFGFGEPRPHSARALEAGGPILLAPGQGAPEQYFVRARALRGRHNLENAMAAALCARVLGVSGSQVQAELDAFPGLPHRLELVRERAGVEWVNDSKATNVDSTQVGLAAFAAARPNVVLILGGRGKRAPYAPLRALFDHRVKAVLTIGEDAPSIERELGDLSPFEHAGTLAAAVQRAAELAREGDVVLLSPACASYDQFRDYEDRGEAFRRLVAGLA
jgi:UDP-N-acetylmuramoylalanine--D-glutamate ligase